MSKTTDTLLGFIAGAAVGAAAGILFAPDKGSKTRKKIKKQAEKYGDDIKTNMNERVDNLKEYVGHVTDDVKERFNKLEKDVEAKTKKAQSKAKTS